MEVKRERKVMTFLGRLLAGLMVLALLGIWLAQLDGLPGAIGLSLIILLSTFAIGSLLGFLFALLRVMSGNHGAPTTSDEAGNDAPQPLLQTNTNLERISDWLTTMLVGVGLSQIANVNTGLVAFRNVVGAYNACPQSGSCTLALAAPMILLFGLIAGFLFMYLYTRIEMVGQFRDAEEGNRLPSRVQKEVKETIRQAREQGVSMLGIGDLAADATVSASEAVELMFGLLYQAGGYLRVIDLAAKLAGTVATNEGNYWFYLAAAFGQKMKAMSAAGDEAEVRNARENALDAARRAVRIDPAYRQRLWAISDPASSDDDLSDLRDDPEFRRIGRP